MRRVLPWALLVLALGITLALAWPLLGSGGGGGDEDVTLLSGGRGDDVAAPSLVGAPGARPPTSGGTRPLRILGEVVDDHGRPLARVPVALRHSPWQRDARKRIRQWIEHLEAPPQPETVAETVSGADGSFTMTVAEPGRYRVEALLPPPRRGSTPYVMFREGVGEQRVTIRVREGSTLRGRVLDPQDEPVAAVLAASAYHPPQWSGIVDPVETDPADGTFTLAALTPGRWNVTLTLPGRMRLTGLVVEMPRDDEWTIRLGSEAGAIVGTVSGEGDAPVAGADLLIRTTDESRNTSSEVRARTRGDGSYALDLVPAGRVTQVRVAHDDYVAVQESPPLAGWSGAEVKSGEELRLDLSLQTGAAVSGSVMDQDTKTPLPDVEVFVAGPQDPYGSTLSARTGADGRYRIAGVGPGRHVLLARHSTHYLPALEARRSRTVQRGPYNSGSIQLVPPALALAVRAEDREVERDLAMRRGLAVRGRVLGPDDAPVEGAEVRAWTFGLREAANRFGVLPPPEGAERVVSAADGTFALTGLPPRDDWVFFAAKKPFVTVPTAKTSLSADGPAPELTLRLTEGAVLAGTLVGPDGKGLVANLYAYPKGPWTPGRSYGNAQSRVDGSFTLEGVPPGDVDLRAWTQSQGSATLAVPGVQAGERREGLRLEIAAGVRVTGLLVDPDGKPVANQSLSVSSSRGTGSISARTDEEGCFAFENAPEGEVRFTVHRFLDGIGQPLNIGKAVAPAEDVRLIVPPEEKTVVEGRVLGPDGQPVPLCRVIVSGARRGQPYYGGSSAQAFREEVVDGHFRREVRGPPPYAVHVSEARDHEGNALNLKPAEKRFEEGEELLVRLEEGIQIDGKVVDETGAGIADVHVFNRAGDAWTGADGRFRLAGFGESGDVVNVEVPGGFVARRPIPVGEGRTEIVIALQSAIGVAGVVLTEDGELRPGASVSAAWQNEDASPGHASAQTDAEGRFEIGGIPRGVRLTLTARVYSSGSMAAPATESDVPAGATDVVLRLSEGVSISGLVVDARGDPVAKGFVQSRHVESSRGTGWAQVGADGRFELGGVAPGKHRLTFTSMTGAPSPAPVEVVAPASGVRIVLPEALTISGRIVGEVPVEGFGVSARTVQKGSYAQSRAVVAPDGTFTLENVAGQPYRLQVGKRGSEYYGKAGPVEPGTTDLVIRLQKGLTIEGTLAAADGTPVKKAWLYAQDDEGGYSYGTVTDGAFRLVGVPPGRYTLRASLPNQQPIELGQAQAGDRNLNLRFGS